MGKTFRRDNRFRPKSHGRTFVKDQQPWKKSKDKRNDPKPEQSSDEV